MRQLRGQILAGIAVSVIFGSTALANRACCLPDGSCVSVRLQEDCDAVDGIVQMNDLTCDTAACGGTEPKCGDGTVDAGEACDDGNDIDDDGCRNDCTIPECGDGIVDAGEACDDGNDDDKDGCRSDCTLSSCGDGIVDDGEACDDGNDDDTDGCRSDCTLSSCGDGIVDDGEACDDGNDDETDGCRSDCTVPFCGDGIEDANEECDDGNNIDGDGCSANCDQEQGGGGGCTPGYWKQRHHYDSWQVYSPADSYNATFGVSPSRDYTLAEALGKGGGGVKALMRHSTAALLNSVNGDVGYAYTEAEVIAIVQDAFATGEYEAAKNLLAAQNEAGCPLN